MRARALDEVFGVLAAEGDEAKILAGGQSLVPALNMRLLEPRLLIDINFLPGLSAIAEHEGGLRIGALARYAELGRPQLAPRLPPLIPQAIPHIPHPPLPT